jgi:hypothetical protein
MGSHVIRYFGFKAQLNRTVGLRPIAEVGWVKKMVGTNGALMNKERPVTLYCNAIAKILNHLGLPARAPPRSPSRDSDLFESV